MSSLPTNNQNNTLSIKAAAELLQVSTKTLRRWEEKGLLVPERTSGGHRRYNLENLGQFRLKKGRAKKIRQTHLKHALEPLSTSEKQAIFPIRRLAFVFGLFLILGLGGNAISAGLPYLLEAIPDFKVIQPGSKIPADITKDTSVGKVLAESTKVQDVIFNINIKTNIDDDLSVDGNTEISGGNLTSSATTFNLVDESVEALNIGGAATSVALGSNTGITTVNNTLNLSRNILTSSGDLLIDPTGGGVKIGTGTPGSVDLEGDDLYVTGDLEVDGTIYGDGSNLTGIASYTGWTFAVDGTSKDDITSGDTLDFVSGDGIDVTRSADDKITIAGELATATNRGVASFSSNFFSVSAGAVSIAAFADGTILDLSAIVHDDSASQGLKLPQAATLTALSSGEGFLAWDSDDDLLQIFDGTSWNAVGLFTDGGTVTYITDTSEDFALGGTDSTSPLFFDESASALDLNPYGTATGNTGELRLSELVASGTNYTGFKSADTLAANVIYTLPTADATVANQVLASDTSGGLSWINVSGGAGALWTDGGDHLYPTSAEYLGDDTSDGTNKIAGVYIADDAPLILGTTNDFAFTYDATTDNRLELAATNQEFAIALGNQDLVLTGSADGTAALTLTAGDLDISDGDLDVAGGDFNVVLDAGDGALIDADNTDTTADALSIDVGTLTDGVDALNINLNATGNSGDDADTFAGINLTASNNTTDQTTDDNIYGLWIQNLGGTAKDGDEIAINIGSGWDSALVVNGTEIVDGSGNIAGGQISGTLFTVAGDSGGGQAIAQADTLSILGGSDGIDTTDSATDTVTLTFDATEVGTETWGSGSAITWTMDSTGGTDPTLGFGADAITLTATTNTIAGGNLDVEGYAAIGDGSTLSVDTGLIVDYDRTYTAVGQQLSVLGTVTGAANTNVYGALIDPESITIPTGTTALAASLYIDEPKLTATGTVTNAASLYITDAPTEAGTGNYALWVDAGAIQFDGALTLGADGADGQLVIFNDLVAGDQTITFNPSASQSAASITYTLPPNDGGSNQVLSSDGSGVLTWIDVSAGAGNLWTNGGAVTYLTSQTDDLALGGTDTTSPLFFDEDASALDLNPYGASAGNTGELRLSELAGSGTNYTGFKSADTLAGNVIYTLPTADATTANQVLASNSSGGLSWINVSAGAGGLWTDGGDHLYPTSAEYLGDDTSDGTNKIAGIYLLDDAPLTLGTTNDFALTYDATTDNRLELAATNQEFAIALGNQDLVLTGSAEGTAALTVSTGDVTISDGDLTVTAAETSLTTDSTTDNSKSLTVSHTGNITGTGYGAYSTVTGTSTTNIAGYFSSSGATSNYAILADAATGDLVGSATSGGDLLLISTSNATKGDIQFHSNSYYINSSGEIVAASDETINGIDINSGAVSDVIDLDVALSAGNTITIDADTTDATADVLSLDIGTLTDAVDGINMNLNVTGDTGDDADTFAGINLTAGNNATDHTTDDNIYGINIANLGGSAKAGNEYAILVGTGWDDVLNYNGTTVIDGTGQLVSTQLTGTLFSTDTDSNSPNTIVQGDTLSIDGDANGIDVTHSGDTVTVAFDGTEVGAETWGTGSGFAWTFNSGTTQPVLTFGDDVLTIGSAATLTATDVTALNLGAATIDFNGAATLQYADASDFLIQDDSGADIFKLTGTTNVIDIGNATDNNAFNFLGTGAVTIAGSADGTDALVLTLGDILVTNGDLDLSGGDFNVVLDAGDSASISNAGATGATAPLTLSNTTAASDTSGSEGLDIALTVTEYADDNAADTHTGLDVLVTNNATDAGTDDIVYGIRLQDLAGTTGQSNNEYGIYQAGTGWDYGAYFEDAVYFAGAETYAGNAQFNDDVSLIFGTGSDVNFLWDTADADAHYMSTVLSGSNNWIINADDNTDWTHGGGTDPRLYIQSADEATVADYVSIHHNQTDGQIAVGTGDLTLASADGGFNFTLGGGAGDDFIVDSTTLVVESDNNQVGIGIAAPIAGLDVRSNAIKFASTSDDVHTWFPYTDGEVYITGDRDGTGTGGINIRSFGDSGSYTNLMNILGTGNVGIGDTGPDAKLEVLATSEQLRLTHTETSIDARFSLDNTGDLTLDMLGGGTVEQLILADADVINIGGSSNPDVAYNIISDSGTATTAASDNDLYIEDILEVDGTFDLDGTASFAGNATFADDISLIFGTGSDVNFLWDTADADAHYMSTVLSGSNNWIINADDNTDWTHGGGTDPRLYIQSADEATVADYISFYHDQTNANIAVGAGDLDIDIAGLDVNLQTAAGDSSIYIYEDSDDGSSYLRFLQSGFDAQYYSSNEHQFFPNDQWDDYVEILRSGADIGLLFVNNDSTGSITGPANGAFTVAAGASQALTLTGNAASTWQTSAGDLTVDSAAGSLILTSGENAADSLVISSDAGGIDITTASAEDIDVSATGGLNLSSSEADNAAITLTTSNAAGGIDFVSSSTTVDALDLTFDSVTTGNGIDLSLDALTTGEGIHLTSTSTSLASGGHLGLFEWNPGSADTSDADMFTINVNSNATVTGDLFNVQDNGSDLFAVMQTKITSAVPHEFTAAGDISVAYDIQFTNQTASYIKSNAPLAIEAGEIFESNNLTLKTYNSGDIIFDIPATGYATFQGALSVDSQQTFTDSDATPDVSGGSHFITNTTAVTITDFDAGSAGLNAGHIIVVESAGAITYDVTAAGFNGGTTDIITAAGDITTWIYDGADWNLIAFMDDSDNQITGADIAELYVSQEELVPGDVVSIDSDNPVMVKKAVSTDDSKVIGIVSTEPHMTLGEGYYEGINVYPVALIGRVPVKMTNTSEEIKPGDLVGASEISGLGKKVAGGYIVGRALESWTPGSGKESVSVFVNPINVGSGLAQDSPTGDLSTDILALFNFESGESSLSIDKILTTDLTVLGDTVLSDTVINGDLTIGGIVFDSVDNSIDAVGTLKLQPMALGDIEIMGGLVTIDTEGNIEATEITAEKFAVKGASAGTSKISAGSSSVYVSTGEVTDESLVLVTPISPTPAPLAVTLKDTGNGFRVEVGEAGNNDIQFDWFIVDKK